MRVARRTRPSQVGYAGSIARRRLLHTNVSSAKDNPLQQSQALTAGLAFVTRIDAHRLEAPVIPSSSHVDTDLTGPHPASQTVATARGR